MKKINLSITLFFTALIVQAQMQTAVGGEEKEKVFSTIKSISVFPGCETEPNWEEKYICTENAIFNHIKNETKYPKEAFDKKDKGIIYMNFVVDTLGDVTNIRLTKGLIWAPSLEAEAIRVIKTLPKMIPGTVVGSKVPVMYSQTIRFYLNELEKKEKLNVKTEFESKKEKRKRLRKEKKALRKTN